VTRRRVAVTAAALAAMVTIGTGASWATYLPTGANAGASTLTPHALGPTSLLSMKTSQPQTSPAGESTPLAGSNSGNIPIDSFSWGAANTVAAPSGSSGARSGRPVFGPLEVTRDLDQISPVFLKDCATGANIAKVTLYVSPDSISAKYHVGDTLEIDLVNVFIAKDQWSGVSGGIKREEITMRYSKYSIKYVANFRSIPPPTTTSTTTSTSTTTTTTTTIYIPPPTTSSTVAG
jgi:type VI protein secretion system component Hcp